MCRLAKKGDKLKALEVKTAELAVEEEKKKAIAESRDAEEKALKLKEEGLIASLSQTTDHKGGCTAGTR